MFTDKKHFKLQLRIVLMFTIIIFFSFIPELNREFFGDWLCNGGSHYYDNAGHLHAAGCQHVNNDHGPTWHWGFRHWMWLLMGLTLSIYNIVLLIGDGIEER